MAKFDDKINSLLNEFTTGISGMMNMSSDNLAPAKGWKYAHDEDEESGKYDDGDGKKERCDFVPCEDDEDMTGHLSDKALVKKVKKSPGKVAGYTIAAAEKELKDKGSLSAKMRKALARDAYAKKKSEEEEITKSNPQYKAARKGKDIGKPGKNFAKIAKSAGKKYGSKEAGKRVAGAILAKMRGK
tara:strand:- start:446 stop:1003 length:558 start_codon:yes stop_codon:yes gene_type:complete